MCVNLHVVLITDAESNQNEAIHHDDRNAEGDDAREHNGLDRVVYTGRRQNSDTRRLDGDGRDDLQPLMLKLGSSNNPDAAN